MNKTIKHMIGQMLLAGFPSMEVDEQARRLVEEYELGNFILFARNIGTAAQVSGLCDALQQLAYEKNGVAAFIAVDQEGGAVSRVGTGAALFPGAMAMAASASAQPYRTGENCARVLRGMGINLCSGPVLDVNIEPMNPIIGSRSYSDDPETAAQLGVQMVYGLQSAGIPATVKHFPGHGNVAADSHLALPKNTTPPEELRRTEWLPFRRTFEAGADALMTCHVVFEQVDPAHPATLSPAIMTDLLRGEMGFDGLAVTDCMEMDAIRRHYGIGPGAVQAVRAGCDLLCFSHTLEAVAEAAQALYRAVADGELSVERIESSYRRILRMKEKYGLLTPPAADAAKAQRLLLDAGIMAENAAAARDSITLLRDAGGLQALKNAAHPRFFAPESIALTGAEDKERVPTRFSELAAARFGGDSVVLPLNALDEATEAAIRDESYDVAVLALFNARFRPGQQEVLRALEAQRRPLVVVLLGAPYDAPLVQNAACVLAAYEYTWLSANAVLAALGTGEFRGRLPVKLPAPAKAQEK